MKKKPISIWLINICGIITTLFDQGLKQDIYHNNIVCKKSVLGWVFFSSSSSFFFKGKQFYSLFIESYISIFFFDFSHFLLFYCLLSPFFGPGFPALSRKKLYLRSLGFWLRFQHRELSRPPLELWH